ncbi:MAG: HEAT repeat domain-containing protein [Gemmatimonadetes bacterium]|nr:HEAT repeat domain-containing protein [Gemmatimonadota bacterium]
MTTYAADYTDAAEELVQELVRVVKVRRLYGPDHPQRAGIEEAAIERIGALLDAHGTIELKVEESRFLADDRPVYATEAKRESLPWILHREGIRLVAFYQGLTLQELLGFVEDVARVAEGGEDEADDMLVTRLWEQNFYHLRYTFVERVQEEEWAPAFAEEEESLAAGPPIHVDPEEVAAGPETIRRIREDEGALYFLDEEDVATLQAEIEAENKRVLVDDFLTCLRELLVNPVADRVEPILQALDDVQSRLLEDGQYAHVAKLHQLFVPFLESDRPDERALRAFAELRSRALSERTLGTLAARVEAGNLEDRVAASYYRTFAQEDPVALLSRIGDLKRLCQRPAISEALAEIASERLEALRRALTSDDLRAAGAAAFLAGHLGDPRLVDALAHALESDDPAIRREVVLALKQLGGGRALDAVARAVDDPDPAVRLYALRHLVAHRYEPGFPFVAEAVQGEAWRERSPTEQRLLFEAYGALGGQRALEDLSGRVKGGGLFRKPDPEEAACALVGLGAIGSGGARAVVEAALGSKNSLIAQTARQVLDRWSAGAPEPS